MAKILLLADAGATTGFARVSHAIGDRLVLDYGHEIHCLATNFDGDSGAWPTLMRLYLPTKLRQNDVFGTSRFVELLADIMPDVVMMIQDPYVVLRHLFRNKFDTEMILARTRPIIAYMPVDGTNQPPIWAQLPELVKKFPPVRGGSGPKLYPVAMTKFGQEFLGGEVIYHGVDHGKYRKATPENPIYSSVGAEIKNQADARDMLGIDHNAVMVLRVDRNSHRKNFGDTWRAVDPVMQRHPEMVTWFHCKAEGDQLEIPQLLSWNPSTAERYFYPGQFSTKKGWAEEDLAVLYNAADMFVSTSWGEGFGLTLAEAAACELPVVAQAVSSIPEVVGPGGILLKPERLTAVESGQDQWLPDVKKFTIAIERLYASRELRQSLGAAGRQHVVQMFNWDEAARKFNELINRAAQENPVTPVTDEDGEQADAAQDPVAVGTDDD